MSIAFLGSIFAPGRILGSMVPTIHPGARIHPRNSERAFGWSAGRVSRGFPGITSPRPAGDPLRAPRWIRVYGMRLPRLYHGCQGGGALAAYRPAAVSGAPALPVGEMQVRARVAFRELAPGWPVSAGGAASRRDARMILFLA